VGGKNYEKVNKYSETVARGKSPNSANIKASNNPFDILKVCCAYLRNVVSFTNIITVHPIMSMLHFF
jgi:hypothetical protein